MLSAFTRALRTPELRKKIVFTIALVAVFRLGSVVPTPGVSASAVRLCTSTVADSSVYGLINLFSGGALLQLALFALGIMPYITASIILQLLTVVIPRLETLRKEGQAGTHKITQYTRYLTVGLAVLQATSVVAIARTPGSLFQGCAAPIIPDTSLLVLITMVVTMTGGTAVVMWLGELITDRGVGNGMSLLIFSSIAARFPAQLGALLRQNGVAVFALIMVVFLVIVAAVVFVEQAQRRIPVQYAKRMVGRRMYGGTSTYIPIKVNQAGVIPVIFASSLLYLPSLIAQIAGENTGWGAWVQRYLVRGDHPVYMAIYFLLILFFTYFYVSITFNATEVADNMKRFGGFIPGIRAGRPTAEYLEHVLNRVTLPGALYLGLVAIIPLALLSGLSGSAGGVAYAFGGTSVLIIVGVGLDTVKQVESQLQQRNYEGFLR